MGDTKDLAHSEAIRKMKELAEEIQICMFCTYWNQKLESRPMSMQQVDEEGNLWFLSDKRTHKNETIASDPRVELLFAKGNEKFLAVHGKASILFDKEKAKELWNPVAKIWFPDGVDDPNVSVIKVKFENGYYWDTKHGKMVEMFIMAAALISGKPMDDGIEGQLRN